MALLNNRKDVVKKRLNKYFKAPYIKKYSPLTKNLGAYGNKAAGNLGYGAGYGNGYGRMNSAVAGLGFNPLLDRLERMSEYAIMDYQSEIYAGLDIYCLAEDTIIPTLDGNNYTIKELSEKKESFYVYSSDGKNIIPAKCKSSQKTGVDQPVYKIILDDNTEIEATLNHKFMMRDGSYKEVKDLKSGDSLMPLYRRISSKDEGDRITGYEMIFLSDKEKWEYTHTLVKKEFYDNAKGVCHHKDFNKRNNMPENIQIMKWGEHQKYHSDLNSFRWKNDKEYSSKMAKIFSKHAKEMWKDEEFKTKFINAVKNMMANLTEEDRKRFSNPGEKNGMFNNGYKLKGRKNGRWIESNHIFDLELYNNIIQFIISTKSRSKNIISEYIYKTLNKKINKKFIKDNSDGKFNNMQELINYLVPKRTEFIKRIIRKGKDNNNYRKDITIDKILELAKTCNSINQLRKKLNCHFNLILRRCNEYNINPKELFNYNHKIKSIQFSRYVDVYDLTVEKYHNFAIGDGKNGYIIVHNSDDTTTKFIDGNVLHINTQHEEIKQALDDLYFGILNINFSLWGWVRDTLKYGDNFLLLDLNVDEGVGGALPLSVYEVERVEDVFDEENPVKFLLNNNTTREFNIYEIAHFRMFGDMAYRPYGCSILESCRRYWRQINMLEDAMIIYRIMRSPERRVIYVDVANLPPEAVEGYVSDVMNNMKNTPIDTNNSGNLDYRLNVMSMMDDYVIPVRGKDSGTRIDTLKSAKSLTDMEDIRYLQNKLVTALKVPKRYLGLDNENNTDLKNAAAQEDIRFSRTIERIQGMIISELKKIGITHLILKGFDPEKADQFELELKNPSSASEVEKLEVIKQKFGIAADILEGKLADRQWVYDNILQFTEDEIKLINDGLIKDFKYMAFVNSFAKTATKKYEQEFEKKFNVEKPEDALAGQMGGAPGAIPADAASDENEDVDVSGDFKNMNIGGGNSVAHRLGAKSPTSTILRPYENKSVDKISKNNKLLEESKKKDLLLAKLAKKNEELIEDLDEIKDAFNLE